MSTQAARSIRTILASLTTPTWLWSWNGVCFGYRRGDSLFTYDGVEVGRFSGVEIYDANGSYLGEVRITEDGGNRLTTSSYKKSLIGPSFVPTLENAQKRPADRNHEWLYCGYEDFPSPETLRNNFLERRRMIRSSTNADHIH